METSFIMETPIYRKGREDESHPEENSHQAMEETHLKWDKVLPIALLHIQLAPRSRLGLSPYKIIYGRQFLASKSKERETFLMQEVKIKQYVQQIDQLLTATHEFVSQRSPPHLEVPLHPFKAEYWVLLEMWKEQGPEQQLEEKWKGPYDILLTTHASQIVWSKTMGTSH